MEKGFSSSLDSQQKMLKNVKGLMLGRVIILTLLLAITFLFQVSEKKYFFIPLTHAFYYFISFFYFVTIVYALLLKRVKDLRKYALTQIIIDHLFITLMIYFTGGKESFFPITYTFSIIGSSILFYKRGAFFAASLSTFFYGMLLLLQLHQWINPLGQPSSYEATQIFYSLIIYMAAFYIVAFLSSAISEELKKKKKELIQKQVDYNQLEAFNRNIIQSLDSGLLTIDQAGRINFLNRTAEKILNRNGKDLYQTSIYDLFPQIHEAIEKVRRKFPDPFPSDYQRYEAILNHSDGKKTHLGFSISPLTDPDGSLIGHTLIFQDITKFKEMEEQIKRVDKMAAIGLLAAGMAHEIRNPLASLSGSIQMLKSELHLDSSQRHLMEITLRESERLNALITDFLLFAQPPQTHRVPVAIETLLNETIEMFTHSPHYQEGIRLIGPELHQPIEASVDPDQMKQVFWNLLLNASQAIANGGEIRIQIEKEKDFWGGVFSDKNWEKGKDWVKISFNDSGEGIDPKEKEKIFEPFYTTKEGGTGLGLSIVHKIIENHSGMIKVESQLGKGSTFTILLPAN